ncbi:MAG: hypothetical protein WBC61_02785, partial [Dehalococcoidia bacterium]
MPQVDTPKVTNFVANCYIAMRTVTVTLKQVAVVAARTSVQVSHLPTIPSLESMDIVSISCKDSAYYCTLGKGRRANGYG